MWLFPDSGPKKGLSGNGFTKTVTLRLRSIVPKRQTAHGLLRCNGLLLKTISRALWLRVTKNSQTRTFYKKKDFVSFLNKKICARPGKLLNTLVCLDQAHTMH
jgi:hypothetical protein